jgi:carbon-monoxide dehydrogenase medium subunit
MQETGYAAPHSVEEAVRLLAGANGKRARVLAGGTDLLVQMRTGQQQVSLLVDVKRIPETTALRLDPDGLQLGAAVSAAEIREHPEIGEAWPGLVEAAALIGSEQIQGRATLGGNLCNGSPAADTVPALIAVGATCLVAGPSGTRTIAVEDFVRGPGETVLGPGELLVQLQVSTRAAGSADAYLRFTPRTEMDIAVAGAGVSVTVDGEGRCTAARVALGAVAPTAILVPEAAAALVGSRADEAALARVSEAASAAAHPIDDLRGTVAFRRHVVGVLARRAASIATRRALARGDV